MLSERNLFRILFILHLFIGVGACFGGIPVIIDPSGEPMGISPEILKNAPFDNFLIPGLVLFFVIGVGNIITGTFAKKKSTFQGFYSTFMGIILVSWIIIQCYMLKDINVLHIIYFVLGLVLVILGIILIRKLNCSLRQLLNHLLEYMPSTKRKS